MEKSEQDNIHIHIMFTFSTGSHRSFTVLEKVTSTLQEIEGVKSSIAFPRKIVSIDTEYDTYTALNNIKKTNNYFHDLTDIADFKDAVYRYSYLSKNETKNSLLLKGIRITQSKSPTANKTKREQKKRKIKKY